MSTKLFGGKPEPMTRAELTEAMDLVYERLKKVHELAEPLRLLEFDSPNFKVTAEIYGTLKTLGAVVDEIIRKLPD